MPGLFLNGTYFSYADIETRVTGLGTAFTAALFVGYTSLNYNDKLGRAYVRGTAIAPLGSTRGQWEGAGDWEFHKPQADAILRGMGPRWRETPLALTVSYGSPLQGIPITTDILSNVLLTDLDAPNADGTESLKRKFTLFIVSPINWGGNGPGFIEVKFPLAIG